MKAISESTLSADHRNHLSRRSALKGTAAVGCTLSATVVGAAIGSSLPRPACAAEVAALPSPFDQLEAELIDCLSSWQSIADFERCNTWRLSLLEQAAATEITAQADAAAALRFALRVAAEDGPESFDAREITFAGLGYPEEGLILNIIQNVWRYLAGPISGTF